MEGNDSAAWMVMTQDSAAWRVMTQDSAASRVMTLTYRWVAGGCVRSMSAYSFMIYNIILKINPHPEKIGFRSRLINDMNSTCYSFKHLFILASNGNE